jgi:O-antigen ligase
MLARAELRPTRLLEAGLLSAAFLVGIVAGLNPPVALGLTIGLVFLGIAMTNLTAGICLFAVGTFLDSVLPADAQGTLSVPKLLGLALILSWLATVTTSDRERRERIFSHPGFLYVLIALVAWTALSASWAENPGAAISAATRYLPNAFLFLILFAGVRTRDQLLWVVGAMVVGASIAAIYGIAFPSPDDPGRVGLGNANGAASFLVEGATLAAALAITARDRPALRWASAIVVPLCIIGVFLTLSRGGLVSLAASLIAAVLVAHRHRTAVLTAGLCAVLAAVVYFGAFASTEARQRVLETKGGTGRTDIWKVGWRMVEAHPVVGVGAGNFPTSSIHYLLAPGSILRDDFIVDNPKVAHNTYLNVLAELGIVGLVLFLSVIGFSFYCAGKAIRAASQAGDRQLEVLSRAMIVVLVGILAADFFGSREYDKQLWLVLALCPVLLEISRVELAALPARAAAVARPLSALRA